MPDTQALIRECEENTVITRAPLIARNVATNIKSIHNHTHISRLAINGDALVIGAGPSAIADIKSLMPSEYGAYPYVIALNGSHKLATSMGYAPDLVVSAESLDMSESLDTGPWSLIAADWSSNPKVFDRCGFWFTDGSPFSRVAARAGYPPTNYSCSALCAAIEIALNAGASNVFVAGGDSCYPPEANAYANETTWEGMSIERTEERLIFKRNEKREKLHIDAGVPPVPWNRKRLQVNGVDTVPELLAQAEWICRRKVSAMVHVLSPWFKMMMQSDVPRRIMRAGGRRYAMRDATEIDVIPELDAADRLCDYFLGDSDEIDIAAMCDGLAFAQLFGISDTMLFRREKPKNAANLRGTYEIMRASVAECRRILNGGNIQT